MFVVANIFVLPRERGRGPRNRLGGGGRPGARRAPVGAGDARTATVRFGHPYAVVAAVSTHRRPAAPRSALVWHGLPVFSAWVSEPGDAEANSNPA